MQQSTMSFSFAVLNAQRSKQYSKNRQSQKHHTKVKGMFLKLLAVNITSHRGERGRRLRIRREGTAQIYPIIVNKMSQLYICRAKILIAYQTRQELQRCSQTSSTKKERLAELEAAYITVLINGSWTYQSTYIM